MGVEQVTLSRFSDLNKLPVFLVFPDLHALQTRLEGGGFLRRGII